MVHITVRNESGSRLKVGFYLLGMLNPTRLNNDLPPGNTFYAGDFPSFLPQSLEIRHDQGAGFRNGETLAQLAQMSMAGAAGAAAIVTSAAGVLAGVLWKAAHVGQISIDYFFLLTES